MDKLIGACRERASIMVWNAADIGVHTRDVGLEGSLTHVAKTFAPKSKRETEILEGNAKEVATKLIGKLKENRLI